MKIKDARICRDCNNLVTTDQTCPLCNVVTEPHPQREITEQYCMQCAEGPFPAEGMHLVTWNEDPYLQFDEGDDLVAICFKCHFENEAEEAL